MTWRRYSTFHRNAEQNFPVLWIASFKTHQKMKRQATLNIILWNLESDADWDLWKEAMDTNDWRLASINIWCFIPWWLLDEKIYSEEKLWFQFSIKFKALDRTNKSFMAFCMADGRNFCIKRDRSPSHSSLEVTLNHHLSSTFPLLLLAKSYLIIIIIIIITKPFTVGFVV